MAFFTAHKKEIFCIVFIGALVFANTLFNGFIGDDEVFIVDNSFYSSWQNFPSLFSEDYFPGGSKNQDQPGNYYSGSVAYRPVLSATYFLDHWLWQLKPFGYHLSNIILHIATTLLVYGLLYLIVQNKTTALLVALLFCVHPVQSEVVSNIGYRADLLSSFFVLASFICFLKRDLEDHDPKLYLSLSLIFYFLALFTKESSIVLIFFLIGYDHYFRNHRQGDMIKNFMSRFGGYFLVMFYYLFVYVFVFPNITLGKVGLIGGDILTHTLASFWIFAIHIKNLLMPFAVTMLPPIYVPTVGTHLIPKIVLAISLFIAVIFLIIKLFGKHRMISFFLFWFLVALIPVSNIFPNANPIAHRYLYLPMIGFVCAIVLIGQKLTVEWKALDQYAHLRKILAISLIIMCIAVTYPMNYQWRSNYTVALQLIQKYPDHYKGYSILGFEYFKDQKFQEAQTALYRSLELGDRDPRIYSMLQASAKSQKKR